MSAMCRTAIVMAVGLSASLSHAGSLVCFEAEQATNIVALMQVGGPGIAVTNQGWSAVKEASGDRYVEIAQAPAKEVSATEPAAAATEVIPGETVFSFDVSADGVHYLWSRVWWLDACGNSIRISIDGAKPFLFGEDGTFRSWHWLKAMDGLKQLKLSKGTHKMVIYAREDGIRIDQILLTDDPDFVPVGIEDLTPAKPAAPESVEK